MTDINNVDAADVATAAAAMRDAHSTEEAQRRMYESHPGTGLDRPEQDPEAKRLDVA